MPCPDPSWPPAAHRLSILGSPRLESRNDSGLGRVRQPRPLALLSVLSIAGTQGMTRERLMGLLWSEDDESHARRHLSDTLYIAHHDLGHDTITTSGAAVHLNPERISTDVEAFRAALARRDPSAAVAVYGGPLLDGFHLAAAPVFEEWLAIERQRHETEYAKALEALALTCEVDGDYVGAVEWWYRLGALDPLNSRVAICTARALLAGGNRGNALGHLQMHADRLREELGIERAPEILAALEEVRRATASPVAVAPPAANHDPDPRPPTLAEPRPALPGARRGSAFRRTAWWAATASAIVIFAVFGITRTSRDRAVNATVLDPDLVAVIPFRAASHETALNDLGLFLPDLFWEHLTGEFGPRAVEPVRLVRRWRAAGGTQVTPVSDEEAHAIAREMGAGHVLLGSVAGTLGRLTLTATLHDTRDRAVDARPVAVEGPYDSVRVLVGRLVNLLLAADADVPRHHSEVLATRPVKAVQAYLRGLRTSRANPWSRELFDLALLMDPGLMIASLAAYQAGELDQGLARVLWERRDELPLLDRDFIVPLMGWRFGASRSLVERLTQYDSATHRAPGWESAGAWAASTGTWGRVIGEELWLPRARAMHTDLAARCPDNLSTWARLFALAMFAEDTAAARHHAEQYLTRSSAEPATPSAFPWSIRLRLALLEGDSAAAAALWEEADGVIERVPMSAPLSLYGSHLGPITGGLLIDGRGLPDLDRFVKRARAQLPLASFPDFNWARARGRSEDHRIARDRLYAALPPVTAAGLRIRDALFLGEPADSAVTAAASFLDLVTHGTIRPPPDSADPTPDAVGPARALCWSTLWRVAHGETAGARTAAAELRERVPLPYRYAVCASLIEVALAQRGDGDLAESLGRLDSLDRAVPLEIWPYHHGARDLTFGIAGLVLARLLPTIGDTAGALAASRRGPRGPVGLDPDPHIWLGMLPDYLREEARLATAAGDTTGALSAYRHYLTVREGSTGRWAEEWRRMQQEYAALAAAERR